MTVLKINFSNYLMDRLNLKILFSEDKRNKNNIPA